MSMPSGDSPEDARDFYHYLQGHHQSQAGRDLARRLAFARLALGLRRRPAPWYSSSGCGSTGRLGTREGIYPLDSFGGWTTEAAGPATGFFLLFTA